MDRTTTTFQKTGETAQAVARTAQGSARVVSDYVARSQELNTRFAQRVAGDWTDVLRRQTELTQGMVRELHERAEEQSDAFRRLYGQWASTFTSFPVAGMAYDPFAVQRRGLRVAETATRDVAVRSGGFPIPGYDELNVNEVSARLDGLDVDQLEKVREYEKRNKNRDTVIEQIDRKIRVAS